MMLINHKFLFVHEKLSEKLSAELFDALEQV